MTDPTFKILAVCTANMCRSPTLELLVRSMNPDITINSAGTAAVDGGFLDDQIRILLENRGIDTTGFATRELTAQAIRESDLILTATRFHRSRVVEMVPTAVRQTFTIREFLRLAPGSTELGDPVDACRHAVSAAFAQRQAAAQPDFDDIADPRGHRRRAYVRCVEALDECAQALVRRLTADIASTPTEAGSSLKRTDSEP